ncbi:MAG TPA: tyrosine-type recombinase/integrase [Chthoniobacterales bacterium]|nr:tyrosine-type recombinase/integrase [Chthoniobacterales bacterium]
MASLRKYPGSKFWFACFTAPDGRRLQRSTRETDKKRALKIAHQYEGASEIGRQGLLTERHARKVIGEIFLISNRQVLAQETIGAYLSRWLGSKKNRLGHKSFVRYSQLLDSFLKWLGPARASFGLVHLSSSEIARFRDYLVNERSPATVNVALAVLQTALEDAFNDGLVDTNEAARVQKLDERTKANVGRRAFTRGELSKILEACDLEWKGMVLTSLYAGGMRLGDVADLRWEHIDLSLREIRFVTEKTGRQTILPIAEPLYRHWSLIAGDSPRGPLFPRAFGLRRRDIPTSALSNQFYKILTNAGLVEKRDHHGKGKGRDAKRATGGLGFHCLRHTATTLLKAGGVSDAVTREIIGHESPAVSRAYSHIDSGVLRDALAKLPDLV